MCSINDLPKCRQVPLDYVQYIQSQISSTNTLSELPELPECYQKFLANGRRVHKSTYGNPNLVVTVSIDDYKQATPGRYRSNHIAEVSQLLADLRNSGQVVTTRSCYEVLKRRVRKIYLDVEKVPTSCPDLIHELCSDFTLFLCTKGAEQITEEPSCVITFNKASATHEGMSYHVIFHNYAMDYKNMLGIVTEFVNTVGKKYIEYVDTSVYSSLRLFKLPYFVGIKRDVGIDDNPDNHHAIWNYEQLSNLSGIITKDYVIQYTKGCKELAIDFVMKPDFITNKISFTPMAKKPLLPTVVKRLDHIEQLLDRRAPGPSGPSEEDFQRELNIILDNFDELSNIAAEKVQKILDDLKSGNQLTETQLRCHLSLLTSIRHKYKLPPAKKVVPPSDERPSEQSTIPPTIPPPAVQRTNVEIDPKVPGRHLEFHWGNRPNNS